jgi:hypothetical protein
MYLIFYYIELLKALPMAHLGGLEVLPVYSDFIFVSGSLFFMILPLSLQSQKQRSRRESS